MPGREVFTRAFAQALTKACDDRGLTQKHIGELIARRQYDRLGPGPHREQQISRAARQWPRRLSAWKRGDRLPAVEAELFLALDVIAPGQSRRQWLEVWLRASGGTPPAPGPVWPAASQGVPVADAEPSPIGNPGGVQVRDRSREDRPIVVVGRPPRLADAFQPRADLRQRIDAALDTARGGRTQVLAGDGGTGKSQLAAAVFDHALAHGVRLGVWITATSRVSIVSGLARAAMVTSSGGDGQGLRQADAFLEWLRCAPQPWMIVLDDVRDPSDVSGLWPAGAGKVLVTTRRRDAALAGRSTQPVINVEAFSARESHAYLAQKLTVDRGLPASVLTGSQGLAEDLGHLPLALAQAAAVIANDAVTCALYRTQLTDGACDLGDIFRDDSGDDHEPTLSNTWAVAIRSADALAPCGLAGMLLPVAAVLSPDGIPEEVLSTAACRRFLARAGRSGEVGAHRDPGAMTSREDSRRALRNLHRLSLLTHEPEGGPQAVRMHALTQRASLQHLSAQERATAVRVAADALVEAWPEGELGERMTSSLRHNTAALLKRFPEQLWVGGAHPVLFRLGDSLGGAGLVEAALEHYQEMAATAERLLGPHHLHTFSARGHVALFLSVQGETARAHRLVLAITQEVLPFLGEDHHDVLASRYLSAQLVGRLDGPEAAAESHRELAFDLARVLGPDHMHTLLARSAWSYWIGRSGDASGAASGTAALLVDLLRVLGPDHPDTLASRGNLAAWLGMAGRPGQALDLFRQLLPDRVRVLGSHHPDTLLTRGTIAYWQGRTGDVRGARHAFEELLRHSLNAHGTHDVRDLLRQGDVMSLRGHASALAAAAVTYSEMLNSLTARDVARAEAGPDHAYWCGLTAPRMIQASTCVGASPSAGGAYGRS